MTYTQPPATIQAEFLRWHDRAVVLHQTGRGASLPPPAVLAWAQRHSPDHLRLIDLYCPLTTGARP